MDNVARYRSMEAFCRHRALQEIKESDVWLNKAAVFSRLAAAESESLMVAVANQGIPGRNGLYQNNQESSTDPVKSPG
jgi:hypothetical protein